MRLILVVATVLAVSGPATPASAAYGEVRFTFDSGVADSSGSVHLSVRRANGGTVGTTSNDGGLAAQFKAVCGGSGCPRAILESGSAGVLNPGTRPFSYGAKLRLKAADVRNGANVVQKGFAGPGSQFKLQADGGRVSCVVVGAGSKQIQRARWSTSIADGRWHSVGCRREPGRLVMTVDGVERASVAIARSLSISNSNPLRIGGKNVSTNNDQFIGDIDDVYFRKD